MKEQIVLLIENGADGGIILLLFWWVWFLSTVYMIWLIVSAKKGNDVSMSMIKTISIIGIVVAIINLLVLFNYPYHYARYLNKKHYLKCFLRVIPSILYWKSLKDIKLAKVGVTVGLTIALMEF